MASLQIEWDASDVMRAFPQLDLEEAEAILKHMSHYWADKEIGLLRRLCVEAGSHSGEPGDFEMGPDGAPRPMG